VNGWPWDSGSHTNRVVALLHWRGCLSPEKVGKIKYLVDSRSFVRQNQSSRPIFF